MTVFMWWQRHKERRRIEQLAKASASSAYTSARELCGAIGPDVIEFEFTFRPPGTLTLDKIADLFANGYREQVHADAKRGALDGFADYASSRSDT